jgi:hypothetical protein
MLAKLERWMVRSRQIAIQLIDTQLLNETVGQVTKTSRLEMLGMEVEASQNAYNEGNIAITLYRRILREQSCLRKEEPASLMTVY